MMLYILIYGNVKQTADNNSIGNFISATKYVLFYSSAGQLDRLTLAVNT